MFHKAIGASTNMSVQETSHLIGVAFVPLKALIEGNGRTRTTGLYDVIAKDRVYQSVQSLSSIKAEQDSFGKIKVCINASINIKKLMSGEIPMQSSLFQAQEPSVRASAQSAASKMVSFG